MRLIDADEAKRTYRKDTFDTEEDFERVNDILDSAPTVDAVEVVRCRDCKHCRNLQNGLWLSCNEREYKGEAVCVEPDDFCSRGERRTDNG